MNNLIIEQTPKTPAIDFNATSGILNISGKSIPEDTFSFYQVLIDWVKEYLEKPCRQTIIHVNVEYLNTSSSKRVLHLFKQIQTAHDARKTNAKVIWQVDKDDSDIKETGEEIKHMLTMPFEFE